MKKLLVFLGTLTVLGLLFITCNKDGDDDNNNTGTNPNTGTITINVSSGTTPQFSWSGGNVFEIKVVRTSDETTIVWGAATPGVDGIASPVTHGTLPAGAVPTAMVQPPETTLTSGVQYRVSATRIAGSEFGWTDFTP